LRRLSSLGVVGRSHSEITLSVKASRQEDPERENTSTTEVIAFYNIISKQYSVMFAVIYSLEVKSLGLVHTPGEGISQSCDSWELWNHFFWQSWGLNLGPEIIF
jgi:hypothetical protein